MNFHKMIVHPKIKCTLHLLNLMWFQIFIHIYFICAFFALLNTKDINLKKMYKMVATGIRSRKKYNPLFQHSFKYLLFMFNRNQNRFGQSGG